MGKTIKKYNWFKIGACFGTVMCILLMCFTIYFTPDFVAHNLSADGILKPTTISKINRIRLGFDILSTIGLLICVLYIIKPNIFRKFYSKYTIKLNIFINFCSNLDQILKQRLKLMLFLFPIVFVIFTVWLKSVYPLMYHELMWKEDSILEWLQFIFYFSAFIVSFSISITYYKSNSIVFCVMYMLLSIGLFFIAMEEISWGQRIFSVPTSGLFMKYNYQKEMNFHNIEGFPIDNLYIIIGLYGAFSRFIIPKKIKIKYGSTVDLFVPDYHLFFYFFVVGILYLYYSHLSSIAVNLFGDWAGWGKGHFIRGKDQEPAEFLLSCGFLLFVGINKFRQIRNKNFEPAVEEK